MSQKNEGGFINKEEDTMGLTEKVSFYCKQNFLSAELSLASDLDTEVLSLGMAGGFKD